MAVRPFYVGEALQSYHRQRKMLNLLTEEECLAALRLESETRRRHSMLVRLVQRAVHLREQAYSLQLKRKFLNASQSE
jgi:hypothetical protein